jgi:hypothetical protein
MQMRLNLGRKKMIQDKIFLEPVWYLGQFAKDALLLSVVLLLCSIQNKTA